MDNENELIRRGDAVSIVREEMRRAASFGHHHGPILAAVRDAIAAIPAVTAPRQSSSAP